MAQVIAYATYQEYVSCDGVWTVDLPSGLNIIVDFSRTLSVESEKEMNKGTSGQPHTHVHGCSCDFRYLAH